jgi:hypothetical protein
MPIIVKEALPITVKLLDIDPSGDTFATFRPATTAQEHERQRVFVEKTHYRKIEDDTEYAVYNEASLMDRISMELFLTLVECNVVYEDKNGEAAPLFKSRKVTGDRTVLDMTRDQFVKALGLTSNEVLTSMHRACLEVNPNWAF